MAPSRGRVTILRCRNPSHAPTPLNAVFLASLNRWIRVDARGNKQGVDAQFSIEEEKLAFPPAIEKGEYIFETIFTDPDVGVVAYLTSNTDLKEAWADLPESLTSPQ